MFMVSARTARKWAGRYRLEGPAGMADRSSRPHHQPTRTSQVLTREIVSLRWRHRLGPVQIGGRLGLPASTVHAVLVRCRINRLTPDVLQRAVAWFTDRRVSVERVLSDSGSALTRRSRPPSSTGNSRRSPGDPTGPD